jgi:hypothetical protein
MRFMKGYGKISSSEAAPTATANELKLVSVR